MRRLPTRFGKAADKLARFFLCGRLRAAEAVRFLLGCLRLPRFLFPLTLLEGT